MKTGRTWKDQTSRRKTLAKKNPAKAIAEHRKREKRRRKHAHEARP